MIDLLKIGIEIQLTNLVSSELTKITKGLLGLDNATIKAIKSMGAFKTTVVGIGSMAFGAGILAGFYGIAKAGNQLEKQVGSLKAQFNDLSVAQENAFRKSAIDIANKANFPTTPSQVAAAGVENFTLFKNFDEAMSMMTFAAKMKSIIGGQFGESEEEADTDYKNMLKAAEIGGYTKDKNGNMSVGATSSALELLERLRVSTAGYAKSGDILQFYKQAATVLRSVPMDGAVGLSAGLISQYGGAKAGTMLQAFGQQFMAGKMTKAAAGEMAALGLGHYGKFTGQSLLDKGDLFGYISTVVAPAIHAAYMKKHRAGQTEAAFDSEEVGKIASRNTTGRLLTDFLSNLPLLKKEMLGVGMAGNLDQQNADLKAHNLEYQMQGLKDAFKSLAEELGVNIVPFTIWGLNKLTEAVKFLNTEIAAHPTIAKDLMLLAGGIGGLLVVFGGFAAVAGGIALFAALPAAGIVATIAAVGTGLTILAGIYAVYHTKINAWVSGIVDATTTGLSNIWTSLKNGFVKFFTNFSQWAKDFFGPGGVPGANMRTGNTAARMQKERYTPNYGSNGLPIQHISFNVDGKEVSKIVLNHATNTINRDRSGMTGFNQRGGYTPPGLVTL